MKKFVIGLDFFGQLLILLLGSAFLIYQNNYFATQLFAICWLPYCVYLVFNLASYKEFPSFKQSAFSLLNILFLGILLVTDSLILIEFVLCLVLGELVAISIAISYYFLFKKGLNGRRAYELFGKKGAFIWAFFFTAIIYPYLGEAVIYAAANDINVSMIIAFSFTLGLGVNRQIKSITALVERRNKNPEQVSKELEKALDRSLPMDFDTKVLLVSLGLWFLGIGPIWAIYVHNA